MEFKKPKGEVYFHTRGNPDRAKATACPPSFLAGCCKIVEILSERLQVPIDINIFAIDDGNCTGRIVLGKMELAEVHPVIYYPNELQEGKIGVRILGYLPSPKSSMDEVIDHLERTIKKSTTYESIIIVLKHFRVHQ